MTWSARIDLAAIDRSQFNVLEEGGEVLILSRKDKFHWLDEEIHLRSLVTDAEGRVLSAGLPKFFNFGERPEEDLELAEALARGAVEFREKIDGSLIVADRIEGVPRLRTRGRRTLGEFGPRVEALIDSRHPGLRDFLRLDPLLETHSLQFEMVAPESTIVLRYREPGFHLLGRVSKATLRADWDPEALGRVTAATGILRPPAPSFPVDLAGVLAEVRAWTGREGVVARFPSRDGDRFVKLKAADYLRLHAHRSHLAGRRARRIAWLLDVRTSEDLLPALARYGLDWEAAQFARADVADYLVEQATLNARLESFRAAITPWMESRDRARKREFVDRVRAMLAGDPALRESWWFSVATHLFDDRLDEVQLLLDAAALGEPVPTLRTWRKDADREIRDRLQAPVHEEEG